MSKARPRGRTNFGPFVAILGVQVCALGCINGSLLHHFLAGAVFGLIAGLCLEWWSYRLALRYWTWRYTPPQRQP